MCDRKIRCSEHWTEAVGNQRVVASRDNLTRKSDCRSIRVYATARSLISTSCRAVRWLCRGCATRGRGVCRLVVRKNSLTHRKARGSIRDAIRRGSDWRGLHMIPPWRWRELVFWLQGELPAQEQHLCMQRLARLKPQGNPPDQFARDPQLRSSLAQATPPT